MPSNHTSRRKAITPASTLIARATAEVLRRAADAPGPTTPPEQRSEASVAPVTPDQDRAPRRGEQSELPTAGTSARRAGRKDAHFRHPWSRNRDLERSETLVADPEGGDEVEACARCGGLHPGLCAKHEHGAYNWTLLALGVPPGWIDDQARTADRAHACEVMRGVVSPRGRDREAAIAGCGGWTYQSIDGVVRWVQLHCRDRACPLCQTVETSSLAHDLIAFVKMRIAAGGEIAFCTLTPPKPHGADPRIAVDATRRFWRRLISRSRKRGREFWMRVRGLFRAMEVTWSAEGTPRKHGGIVEYDGFHAHVHILVEWMNAATWRDDWKWIVAQWCELTGGNPAAQHARPAMDDDCWYAAKYVAKAASKMPDRQLRECYITLHGLRLHEGAGTWRSWKKQLPPKRRVKVGEPRDLHGEKLPIAALLEMAASNDRHDEIVRFVDRRAVRAGSSFDEIHLSMPAHEVVARLRADVARRVAAGGSGDSS